MTDYPTSVSIQDPLLERPLNQISSTTSRSIPISTRYGYVLVTQQGPPDRDVIVTYHDVGYNCTLFCFLDKIKIFVFVFSDNAISSFLCLQ